MGIIYKRYYDWGSIGEPRYVAYVDNYDLNTIVDIWTPDSNETAKIALSLKFKLK